MRSSSDQDQITQTLLKQHVHAQERGIKSGSIMIDNTGERLEIDRKGESYACANTELSQGSKKSHYIWYVLPQLSGLGSSVTNQIFSLNSKQALAYLQDDVLRRKYISTLTLIFNSKVRSLSDLFGNDASKVASSLTLFEIIAKSDDVTSQYRAECNQIVRLISQIKKKYPFTECELTTAMLSSARGEVRSVAARLQNTRGAADSSSSSSNILLIEGGRQEVVYANQSNYYTSKTIVDNQHDTIFVLGANESHVYGRNTGGAGQAKATAGNFNILPIVTTQYNKQIPDADILRSGGYHERIAEIAKTFIRNGGKIAWPLRSATREDAELLGCRTVDALLDVAKKAFS